MKALPKRKGNALDHISLYQSDMSLNESPSEKEGKFEPPQCKIRAVNASMKALPKRKGNRTTNRVANSRPYRASMKALPKRKGNPDIVERAYRSRPLGLNESPSEKEGKFAHRHVPKLVRIRLNESPSEKEGKLTLRALPSGSMSLNESPSEKEGK